MSAAEVAHTTSVTSNKPNNNNNSTTMVASFFSATAHQQGGGSTPPQSPHRNAFIKTAVASTMTTPLGKKSPRRASYQVESSSSSSPRHTMTNITNNNNTSTSRSPMNRNRRSSMPATTALESLSIPNSYNMNNTNGSHSPVPLGSRVQPATATAPVVGYHHGNKQALAGFDPLASATSTTGGGAGLSSPPRLNTKSVAQEGGGRDPPRTPPPQPESITSNSNNNNSKDPSIQMSLTLTPPSPHLGANTAASASAVGAAGRNHQQQKKESDDPELTQELRKIAKDLSAASPQRRPKNEISIGSNHQSKATKNRRGSLTPKFNLTPPFRASEHKMMSASSNHAATREPLSAPNHRKLPWQRHRRSKSLETPNAPTSTTTKKQQQQQPPELLFENDATKANSKGSPITPMMQDLYDVVKEQNQQAAASSMAAGGAGGTGAPVSLALPSLYKPAPTSFLTGKEIVRSSEQDPSPFQMEIPSLDQTLVAARAVQFVDVYRKEDINFELQSLVGLPRMVMKSFVQDADSKPPNNRNITQAHRPIVEALLETGDDITMAGFFATENAGSADIRREAVILERQMQFVVIFRGTTQEQNAKTNLFKKVKEQHKQQKAGSSALEPLSNDNSNCKVYSSVKQAYLELEHKVFDCLDKALDQNPFCDVVFTGSSLGGAMATLGAYRYASNRPVVRVCCQTFGAPKVGNTGFRQQVNSLPNLKVIRVEYGNDPKCFAPHDNYGSHVGHAILLSKNNHESNGSSSNSKTLSAVARKFDNHDSRKHNTSKSAALLATFKKERDITSYVSHLEQLHQSKVNKWMTDFAGEDGTGVRGKDNEQRQVV